MVFTETEQKKLEICLIFAIAFQPCWESAFLMKAKPSSFKSIVTYFLFG